MRMNISSQTSVRRLARGVHIALVAASAVFVGDLALAAEGSLTFRAQGQSSLSIARDGEVHRVARTFSVVEPPNPEGEGTIRVVVDETIDTVARPGIEGFVRD